MKKLLKYLSPFAPDQSGVCGVLYELGGIIVICDAGGCAGNICGFDEPRWFTNKSAVFSAGLRDMDAIMGRDDRLIEKLSRAYEQLGARFSALVATPVPAVIATDMKALKRMAEKKLGIPCISVNAIGTRYYDEGEREAWLQLFETFAVEETKKFSEEAKKFSEDAKKSSEECSDARGVKGKIGVIGATPFETGYSTDKPLKSYLEKSGYNDTVIYTVGTTLEDIENASGCEKNLVVSTGAIKAAEYLKEKFGTPYDVAFPFIEDDVLVSACDVLKNLSGTVSRDGSKAVPKNESEVVPKNELEDVTKNVPKNGSEDASRNESENEEKNSVKVLIVHSQFAANEMRKKLRSFVKENIAGDDSKYEFDVATFFTLLPEYAEASDTRLNGEDDLWDLAAEGGYDLIIADKDMERLIRAAGYKGEFVDFPHFAVSGRMNDDSVMFFS